MKMKITLIVATAAFLFFAACNSGDKQAQHPGADSSAGKDSASATATKDSIAEQPEYILRKINLSQAEWPAVQRNSHNAGQPVPATGKIKGDFNGDGKPETVYIVAPVEDSTKPDAQECYGGCNSYLLSSDPAMPVLIIHDNLGGELKNMGDVDGDGADDLLVYPSWWQSNWNPYRLYSFKKSTGEWRYLTEPVSIFAPDLYANPKRVLVKRSPRAGFVTAYTSETDDDGNTKSRYKDFPVIK